MRTAFASIGLSALIARLLSLLLATIASSVALAVAPVELDRSGGVDPIAVLPTSALPADRPLSFELDIQPILSVAGCNTGACHGKQRGQNGFQLSLFGFDSDFDYNAVVRESRGRRISPAAAADSLLVQKATAQLPHGGGTKIEVGSDSYQTLVRWIEQGAPRQIQDETVLQSIELVQSKFSLAPGEQQPLQVIASYADGSQRDVTALTSYLSNEDTIVSVDEAGVVKAGELPGETAVMARYMNIIRVADVVIPQTNPLPADAFAQLPQHNFIDQQLDAKLLQLGIQPSPPAAEHVFVRRAYTDIIGRLPTADELRDYLDRSQELDPADGEAAVAHRAQLIDSLLQRPEYVDHWANQWVDLLRPNPYRVGIKAVLNYDNWIRQQFRDEVPYDEFVRRVVAARGSTWQNGVTTLYRDRRDPEEITTLVSQLFLGIRLDCAKCHHHPFEKWSQQDFYQFAGYFAQVGRKGTGLSPPISGGEEIMFASGSGTVKHPVTGETLQPTPLFGEGGQPQPGQDPREALAQWIASPDNEFFAKVQVNRVWSMLMGRGLVEPVDDLRSTNPPTHPELFDALAAHFRDTGFDNKQLIRTIALSRAYAADSQPNDSNHGDRINYSRHYRQPLRAEVLLDAIADFTQTTTNFNAMPAGSRAAQVWTHRVPSIFLDTFGRPDQNQDPPCERVSEATVTQSLHLMNDVAINSRIRQDSGRAARLAASELTAEAIVDELYLAGYSRYPTEQERTTIAALITEAGDNRRGAVEDIMWAMVNSPEFSIQD